MSRLCCGLESHLWHRILCFVVVIVVVEVVFVIVVVVVVDAAAAAIQCLRRPCEG